MPPLNTSTVAFPIIQVAALSLPNSTCEDIDDCRKLRDIVWSCLVTISACIWVSVHPNCPPTDSTAWQATKRRVKVALIALIAPEIIAAWALQQYVHARRLMTRANQPWPGNGMLSFAYYDEYIQATSLLADRPKLTMQHAFLVIMGGCIFSKDAQRPVFASDLWKDSEETDKLTALGTIRKCDITDKSKSDVFARTLTFLQTLWFVIQCIARAVRKLPLTKLEVVTLAYAALYGFSYAMWWYKPMDLRVPLLLGHPAEATFREADIKNDLRARSGFKRFGDRRIMRIVTLDHEPHHFTRLLWTSETPNHADGKFWFFVVICVLAMGFGGIHAIPWNFAFPSPIEHLLWRYCAVIIVSAPVGVFVTGFISVPLSFRWSINVGI